MSGEAAADASYSSYTDDGETPVTPDRRKKKKKVGDTKKSTVDTARTMSPPINAATNAPTTRSSSSSSPPSTSSTLPPPSSSHSSPWWSQCSVRRTPLVNALHLSLSFCLIFLAFSVAQNSQTSLDPKVGAIGLGILYAVFTLSNTFSAWVLASTGVRLSLFCGALTYALYVAANIQTEPLLLYASSAVIGLGAAILWTAQGAYIAECAGKHEIDHGLPAHSTMGWFNGIFFSIFQANQCIGNLLAALLYTYSATQAAVFSVMTVICGLGVATLLLLPKQSQQRATAGERAHIVRTAARARSEEEAEGEGEDDGEADDEEEEEERGMEDGVVKAEDAKPDVSCLSVLSSLALLRDPRLLLMVPLIIYSGISQSWIYGAFPPLIPGNEQRFFVLAFWGAMDAVFSYVMGKLSDRVGRLPILVLGFVAHAAIFSWIVLGFAPAIVQGPNPDARGNGSFILYMDLPLPWFFVVAVLLGLGDGVFNTQAYAILGTFFKTRAGMAFANFKLFQSLSTALFFFYLYFTDIYAVKSRAIIPLACMSIGMVLVVYLNALFPLDGGRTSGGSINTHSKDEQSRATRSSDVADDDEQLPEEVDEDEDVSAPVKRSSATASSVEEGGSAQRSSRAVVRQR